MRTLTFEVTVEFSSNIKDFELEEVTKNVRNSLMESVNNGYGLSPEESEAITKSIKVKETLSGFQAISTIF
jgi:hypothetical protein